MACADALIAAAPPVLRAGRMHEVAGIGARAFACVQAAGLGGPVIWIRRRGADPVSPYGAADFFDPARLYEVAAQDGRQVLWAAEEALRSGAAPLVVAEPGEYAVDLTAGRRLQLAAEAGQAPGQARREARREVSGESVTGLVLAAAARQACATAAETRWIVEPAPSHSAEAPGPCWRWRLVKNKRGPLGEWVLTWRPDAAAAARGRWAA